MHNTRGTIEEPRQGTKLQKPTRNENSATSLCPYYSSKYRAKESLGPYYSSKYRAREGLGPPTYINFQCHNRSMLKRRTSGREQIAKTTKNDSITDNFHGIIYSDHRLQASKYSTLPTRGPSVTTTFTKSQGTMR